MTKYLVEKETITGEEFMGILNDGSKSEEERVKVKRNKYDSKGVDTYVKSI